MNSIFINEVRQYVENLCAQYQDRAILRSFAEQPKSLPCQFQKMGSHGNNHIRIFGGRMAVDYLLFVLCIHENTITCIFKYNENLHV